MDIRQALPEGCKVETPTPETQLHDVVSRWSDAQVSLPYAVVTPLSSEDIIAAITFASQNNLKIVPTNGGHGSYVPITSKTLYLDMKNFKDISLDEEHSEVTISGGCLSGEVLKYLAGSGEGWFTTLPNANPVGVVGAFLGGLSHSLNGLKGFGIDHVRSITIIPFSDQKARTLTPGSRGGDGDLLNVLCGAGHGLGIVTSITLKAWKISSLNMNDDKIWTRRLIFPAPAISTAAELYTSLTQQEGGIAPELTAVLAFLRAPPTAPVPGAPMIMVALNFFGPSSEADKVCAASFEEKYVDKATVKVTVPTPFEALNEGVEALNAHGGFKEYHGCFCAEIDEKSIVEAFEAWKGFTDGEGLKKRGRSYVVVGSWSTGQLLKHKKETGGRFFDARERGVFVQAAPWYADSKDKEEADGFGKSVVQSMRQRDEEKGLQKRTFVNNLIAGQDMREVYSASQIEEIKRVKGIWDPRSVGWSPVIEGW
ncbi:hypothetical protein BDV96DRAFT_600585 [Lophiotrema nucula]|uniref:FAD-binding PCMH-type domain-containing protein n=1 Tax=Lophiotrema nucula TaxID=690887 RepID=A0A6A5Z6H4_9PLEO|nr:hypothetical protein BDV96DRAFT_600585 [Lophiotrema nucula]